MLAILAMLGVITFAHFEWLRGSYLGHFVLPGWYAAVIVWLQLSHFR